MLVLGCTDRTIPDGESASSSQGTTAASTTGPMTEPDPTTPNPTSGPNPTGPNPTEPNPTGPITTEPITTTSSMSTGVSSTSDTTADTVVVEFCGDGSCSMEESEACSCMDDCGGCPLPAALLSGCPAVWSGGSSVAGMTSFGPFDGHTAFFAWEGFGDDSWSTLRLLVFDAAADLDAAKKAPWSTEFYVLQLSPEWNHPEWVNKGFVDGGFFQNDKFSAHHPLLEVTGTAGNWQNADPNDPPRLLGVIVPSDPNDPQSVKGSFDAVFCDAFISQVIPE